MKEAEYQKQLLLQKIDFVCGLPANLGKHALGVLVVASQDAMNGVLDPCDPPISL